MLFGLVRLGVRVWVVVPSASVWVVVLFISLFGVVAPSSTLLACSSNGL